MRQTGRLGLEAFDWRARLVLNLVCWTPAVCLTLPTSVLANAGSIAPLSTSKVVANADTRKNLASAS